MSHSRARAPKILSSLIGGWTIAVMAFLYLPIILLVACSFNSSTTGLHWGGFTLKWYRLIWRDDGLVLAVENSLIIAAATTVLAVAFGTAAAWLLHRYRFPAQQSIYTLLYVPLIIPEVIMGVSLMMLFRAIGLELGYTTVIIAHVTFCFPFVMAAVQARLAGIDPSLEEAAMDLGATPARAFFSVIVPYLMPAIIAGALLSFTLSLDEFIVTYFTYSAESITLPIRIYGMVKTGVKPTLNAVSALFIVGTALLVLGADALQRRREDAAKEGSE
jgi:spermidine/putrescine transport system permease protein